MKKAVFALLCTMLILWASVSSACTSIIVGKEASDDGSLLVGRNEDISRAYNKNFFVNPATKGEGTVTLTDPINGFTIELPATAQQWTMISDAPEHGDGLYPEVWYNTYCWNPAEVFLSQVMRTLPSKIRKPPLFSERGVYYVYAGTQEQAV